MLLEREILIKDSGYKLALLWYSTISSLCRPQLSSSRCGDTRSLLEASHVVCANSLPAHYSKHSLLYGGVFGSSGGFVLMSLRFLSPVCTLTASGLRQADLSLRRHTHRHLWTVWCAHCWKIKHTFNDGVLVFLCFLTNLTNKYNHKEHAGRPSVAAKSWLIVQELDYQLTIINHVWHQIFEISKGFFETLLILKYISSYLYAQVYIQFRNTSPRKKKKKTCGNQYTVHPYTLKNSGLFFLPKRWDEPVGSFCWVNFCVTQPLG